ncbi:LacI family DNA-binding transcriptional regulator [Clostridium polynesiense]|uniref:LacI family DNA-binding transcriptional regulator n=1 Tax=Clostridium polynesiense TaxID=1325933 RepID=UPI00058DB5C8|nr:LacI family DNA-binding transcriptional regulator [Clostridium polynesiense]
MPTIKDIAERLGVAVSTVSKGLNNASDISDDMRQLVLNTAIEMGYASKKLKTNNERKLCILIANMDYENSNQFGYNIVLGFKQAAARRHWEVTVIPVDSIMQSTEDYDIFMLKNGYSGAFLLGFTMQDNYMHQLKKTKVPTVLLDNFVPNSSVGYVGTDSYEAIDMVISHLLDLGHKKIAFLNGDKNSMVSNDRYFAFKRAMKKHKLKVNPALTAYGYFVPDCAKDYVPKFLKSGATAIVCASDMIASGVINELKLSSVSCPKEVSVVGFDDIPLASKLNPPLTTIRQDRLNLGKSAFSLLDNLLHGVAISKILLRPSLILRSSTDGCQARDK